MSRINRPPKGLQGLLGSQSFGSNPDELLQEVRPSIELFPFWGAELLRHKIINGGRTTNGVIAQHLVPTDEVWAMKQVSCYRIAGFTGAGPHTLQVGLEFSSISGAGASVSPFEVSPVYADLDGTTSFVVSKHFDTPFLLEPNTLVSARALRNTLANPDVMAVSVLYFALPG